MREENRFFCSQCVVFHRFIIFHEFSVESRGNVENFQSVVYQCFFHNSKWQLFFILRIESNISVAIGVDFVLFDNV